MRIFVIKDEELPPEKVLGFLVYYELPKAFFIELPEDADEWETPMLLSSFVKRGIYSLDRYWSRLWVQQRIIPPDRQNLGEILKVNGLKEYDEFTFLLLSMGRCAQDACYIEEIREESLPGWVLQRWETKVEEILPLDSFRLLVFFQNGPSKIVELENLKDAYPSCYYFLTNEKLFSRVDGTPARCVRPFVARTRRWWWHIPMLTAMPSGRCSACAACCATPGWRR